MDKFHEHLRNTPDAARLLFRSRHIYLLLASLINIVLGVYLTRDLAGWRKRLQTLGSVLLLLAPALLLYAFFTEPWRGGWQFVASFYGIIFLLAGTLLHLISAARQRAG